MLHVSSHLVCLRLQVIDAQAPARLLMQVVWEQVPSIQCQSCLCMQFDIIQNESRIKISDTEIKSKTICR